MWFTQLTLLVKVNTDLIQRWWRKKTESAVTSVVRDNANSSGNWSLIIFTHIFFFFLNPFEIYDKQFSVVTFAPLVLYIRNTFPEAALQ